MLVVRDLMLENPATVSPETSMPAVIALMREHDCKQLPVVNSAGKVVGIITHRDCCLVANIPIIDDMTVADCMTAEPITVDPDMPAFRAASFLSTYKFGAVPVVENGDLVGMLTTSHFLYHFALKGEPE